LIDLTTEGLALWKSKSEAKFEDKAAIPCQCKTPDHRPLARIIHENAELHQNRLNGCFPQFSGRQSENPFKQRRAEIAANG
jgi:hypothetical protein